MLEQTRYIDPMIDFSFRRLFGTDPNKEILIDFLNEVFKGRKRIIDLVYNKNEHDGDNTEEARAIFDLLCTGDKGEKILIEVQHSKPANFKKRSIYYTSRLISEQAVKGESKSWKYDISEVYFLAIMEKPSELSIDSERYIHDACLCYRDTGEIFYDGLGYIYLDLSNFVKQKQECIEGLDMWLYCLKHAHEMTEIPAEFRGTILERVFGVLEYINLSKEEQTMYDQDLKRKWDNEATLANSRDEGKAEGKEEGKIAGKAEATIEIAKKLKAKGISMPEIVELTGLSIEEIEQLNVSE